VQNVVAAWKSRLPSINNLSEVGSTELSTDVTPEEGFFIIWHWVLWGFQ